MAQVEGIFQWLENHLGSGVKEPWNSNSISLLLNRKILKQINSVFVELNAQKKLKILLSMFHLPSSSRTELSEELDQLLETAIVDCEESVSLLAEIMKPYPSTGFLNSLDFKATMNEKSAEIFKDLTAQLSEELGTVKSTNIRSLVPLECYYMNKSTMETYTDAKTLACIQESPVKHFVVKGTTKAEQLRQKMTENSASKAPSRKRTFDCVENEDAVPMRVRARPRKQSEIFRPKAPMY